MTEVSYALPSSGKVILKDVNAQLPIGSLIAIVGASGVGKSVLLDIITGLRRPMTGDLYIDNCKLYDHEVIKWRKNITYVPQHPFIFEGTIARNIAQTLPGEDLDYQKVKDAAKKAQINNWIETLPKSYESELEEGGRNLSGGQRQRICIARALYRSNRVLCLDESSNAIDEQTESELFNTLQKLKEKMLILVVTHRSDTLHHFDKVYEIKNGRLTDVR